jgi:NMD protein affecting ribosome stability and mRNA decay
MPQEACVLLQLTSPRRPVLALVRLDARLTCHVRGVRKPDQISLEKMCFSCLPPKTPIARIKANVKTLIVKRNPISRFRSQWENESDDVNREKETKVKGASACGERP